MENQSGFSFGDNVRVRSTPETESRGIAESRGQIYGETTPSVTGIAAIGTLQSDYAINVYFKDRKDSVWLAPELVEFLDHGAGTEISLEGVPKKWTRDATGKWIEKSTKKPWWKLWRLNDIYAGSRDPRIYQI
jgi:hypothetical protein